MHSWKREMLQEGSWGTHAARGWKGWELRAAPQLAAARFRAQAEEADRTPVSKEILPEVRGDRKRLASAWAGGIRSALEWWPSTGTGWETTRKQVHPSCVLQWATDKVAHSQIYTSLGCHCPYHI